MMSKGRILTIFLLLFNISCRKDTDDTQAPIVKIVSPSGGIQAGIPSTIRIIAEASDDVMLQTLTIAVSKNGQRFTAPMVIAIKQKQAVLDTVYHIDDRYLEGGTYSLTVTADDGTNTSSDFSPIQIAPYPDSTLGIWVALTDGVNHRLLLLDESFQPQRDLTLPDSIAGMAYQHRYDNLWLAFKNLNRIRGIKANGNLNWEVNSGLQPLPQFHLWAGELNGNFYTCDRNGFVRTRDPNGQVSWAWTSNETQSIPYFLYRDESRLFVGIQPNGNGEPRFKIIHAQFGGKLLERTLQMTLNNIQKINGDFYWLFGNQGTQGVIARYQYNANSWSVLKTLANESINACHVVSPNEILVATSIGIRRWITGNETLTTPIPPANIKQILPLVNDDLLLVSPQNIHSLNGQVLWTAPSNYRIQFICELANK